MGAIVLIARAQEQDQKAAILRRVAWIESDAAEPH
jgi:hypothetical protein